MFKCKKGPKITNEICNPCFYIQEELRKFFPCWDVIHKHREVVFFTSDLMSDPQPLLNHVGQKWYEMQLNEIRCCDNAEHLSELDLLRLLHWETKIQPYEKWNHNKYVHFFDDKAAIPGIYTPVYDTSHLYAFLETKDEVICTLNEREKEGVVEVPECTIFIKRPNSLYTKSVLATCKKMSQHQSITDLWIQDVACCKLPEPCVFNMSKNAQSLTLDYCTLPSETMKHLMQQISECNTIRKKHLNLINLRNIPPLMLDNKVPLRILNVA